MCPAARVLLCSGSDLRPNARPAPLPGLNPRVLPLHRLPGGTPPLCLVLRPVSRPVLRPVLRLAPSHPARIAQAVAEKLAAVPLFAKAIEATADESASQAFLELLSSHVEAKRVPVGSLIIRKGEIGKEMFFLVEGEVEVLMMLDHTPVATLQPGTAFGEMALLREEPRNAYIRASAGVPDPPGGALAADMVHLLVLSREGLRQVLEQFPSVQAALAVRGHQLSLLRQNYVWSDASVDCCTHRTTRSSGRALWRREIRWRRHTRSRWPR